MAKNQAVDSFTRTIRDSLKSVGMTGKSLVVAVSGGPDSLALLYSLHGLHTELQLRLHGAHLDHSLRGEASRADARYVRGIFESLELPYTLETADVASYQAEHRVSLEQAARTVRYDFLARVARRENADAVALGHTADDQAETVLMHIIRGSGLTGLQGMETMGTRRYEEGDIRLFRPMLSIARHETVEYCRISGLEPREDESNLSHEFTRNRVRHELFPLLEQFNPAVRDALVRLASSTRHDLSFIEREVDARWRSIATVGQGRVCLRIDELRRLDPAIQRHLVRRAVRSVKGDLEDLHQVHSEDMLHLITGPAGKALDLPGGLRFTVGYHAATIAVRQDGCSSPGIVGEQALKMPGETLFGGWRITADLIQRQSEIRAARLHAASDDFSAVLNGDVAQGRLVVRGRRDGDRFQPLGMKGHKKLQDFMVDAKIPREGREGVPIVASASGIVWVVGHRIADWARVPDDASKCLVLRFDRD
ncbi:MAG: tRNA lysidine(34) synthetase TilS [Chloroflexi bacterium]|nr:tRNA lysidine(34) synthetase TilS [Chloroflexota bacterium]